MNDVTTTPINIEDDFNATIASQLGPRKPVQKPNISRLPDAMGEDGTPLFRAGDKIVIERYSSMLQGNPYLDTRTFRVKSVDMETGLVRLYDEYLVQNAYDNWKFGLSAGQVYKFAGKTPINTKKKRGRPKKEQAEGATEAAPPGEKRGRGRPKGSKNRPREEILAAKAAKKLNRKGGV